MLGDDGDDEDDGAVEDTSASGGNEESNDVVTAAAGNKVGMLLPTLLGELFLLSSRSCSFTVLITSERVGMILIVRMASLSMQMQGGEGEKGMRYANATSSE